MPKKETSTIEELLEAGLLMRGDDPRLEIRRLPTIIPGMDGLLGGGWPAGRYTQIVGPESVGKTVMLQFATASQQAQTEKPLCLLIDIERGFDARWWALSGVNTQALLVSQPMTGEEAIDVILATIQAAPELGLVGIDSIGAMYPRAMIEPEKGAEQKFMGNQSTMVKQFFAMVTPQMDDIVFILLNQMRSNLNNASHEEIYPGGWAMRHNNHITLRMRREGWLLEKDKRVGFTMEAINRKNKTGGIQGDSVLIPFKFRGQIDMVQSYIDEALEKKVITSRPPMYYWKALKWMGKEKTRNHFIENEEDFEALKAQLLG